jgi:hypothetical protein
VVALPSREWPNGPTPICPYALWSGWLWNLKHRAFLSRWRKCWSAGTIRPSACRVLAGNMRTSAGSGPHIRTPAKLHDCRYPPAALSAGLYIDIHLFWANKYVACSGYTCYERYRVRRTVQPFDSFDSATLHLPAQVGEFYSTPAWRPNVRWRTGWGPDHSIISSCSSPRRQQLLGLGGVHRHVWLPLSVAAGVRPCPHGEGWSNNSSSLAYRAALRASRASQKSSPNFKGPSLLINLLCITRFNIANHRSVESTKFQVLPRGGIQWSECTDTWKEGTTRIHKNQWYLDGSLF